MNIWLDASFWAGLALAASMISVRLGISVSIPVFHTGYRGGFKRCDPDTDRPGVFPA